MIIAEMHIQGRKVYCKGWFLIVYDEQRQFVASYYNQAHNSLSCRDIGKSRNDLENNNQLKIAISDLNVSVNLH